MSDNICPTENCGTEMGSKKVENCSCHIGPPCSACVDAPLECTKCGHVQKIELINDYRSVIKPDGTFLSWRPRELDKTKIDWHSKSHTNSSMIKEGIYPDGTSLKQVEDEVRGTFGGRFEYFAKGKFKYIAYTD